MPTQSSPTPSYLPTDNVLVTAKLTWVRTAEVEQNSRPQILPFQGTSYFSVEVQHAYQYTIIL